MMMFGASQLRVTRGLSFPGPPPPGMNGYSRKSQIDSNSISETKIKQVLKEIDYESNGKVEFSQFLIHCLSEKHFTQEKVRNLFDDILETKRYYIKIEEQKRKDKELIGVFEDASPVSDHNNAECFDADTLQKYLAKCGRTFELEQVDTMVEYSKRQDS